jgi:hypothetical protein
VLPARKLPTWLRQAAATAEEQVLADGRADDEGSSQSDGPA